MLMTCTVTVDHVVRTQRPRVRAPALQPALDTLLALHHAPNDARARIQASLLTNSGADRCPCCGVAFEVSDYAATRTSFLFRRSLTCSGCRTCFIVEELEQA